MSREPLLDMPGVAGLDEVGRGPLAGPVVAAAVVFRSAPPEGVDDSKVLTPDDRERLAHAIKSCACWAVARVEAQEIDALNIHNASLEAMRRAYDGLAEVPESAIVDGIHVPHGLGCPAEAKIKADATYACVAAASILAKTERDRIMREYAVAFPGYGFDRHFGYPTPEHLEALSARGACSIHRRSFAPVRAVVDPMPLQFSLKLEP